MSNLSVRHDRAFGFHAPNIRMHAETYVLHSLYYNFGMESMCGTPLSLFGAFLLQVGILISEFVFVPKSELDVLTIYKSTVWNFRESRFIS